MILDQANYLKILIIKLVEILVKRIFKNSQEDLWPQNAFKDQILKYQLSQIYLHLDCMNLSFINFSKSFVFNYQWIAMLELMP